MYKNQLQELAQRSCFNLPSYACIREGPDHAPRFKATVNFNGETFGSPNFCTTLRQAEHAAAEVALYELARRGPSRALAARVLDETGVYKNLLQETARRAGLNLPIYTTARSGPGYVPVFSCTVELAGMSFTGEPAKTKKQAQKNAAMAAWSSLKQMSQLGYSSPCSTSSSSCASEGNDEQDQVIVARFLGSLHPAGANKSTQNDRRCRRQKSALVHRDPNLGSGLSLYPIQYQSWAYPNFSPEMNMYRVWHQELATPQHSHLLTLPLAPTPQAVPQIVPLVRSTIQPDDCQYFRARELETIPVLAGIAMPTSGPSLYLSNSLIPVDVRIMSQATLQEIQEDTPGPGCLNANIQSRTSGLSLSKVSCDNQTELKIQETLKDDRQRNVNSDPNIGSSVQLGGSQPKKFKWAPHKCIDTGYKSRAVSPGNVKFGLCNPQFFGSSPSTLTPYQPCQQNSTGVTRGFGLPSFTGPVMVTRVKPVPSESQRAEIPHPQAPAPPIIRTGIPSHSTIIRCGATNVGGRPSVSFMAPAVQIRSVMPVCSASPSRKSPESSKDGLFASGKEGSKEPEKMSDAISRLGKLHI